MYDESIELKSWDHINVTSTHPGKFIEDWLDSADIDSTELANRLGVSTRVLHEIISGNLMYSPLTALKLARVFSTTPQFWLNARQNYQASVAWDHHSDEIKDIEPAVEPHDNVKIDSGVISDD